MGAGEDGERGDKTAGHGTKPAHHPHAQVKVELPATGKGCHPLRMFPRLEEAYNIYLELVDIFNRKSKPTEARLNLARWYNKVEAFGDEGFSEVIETFENHNATIVNYFEDRLTNASAESFNAKIKAFRTQFRGVGDIRFFMYRLATLYS